MEERKPILSIKELSVNYGAIKALKGANLDVYHGEIVAVIGANGAGKSTMMSAIVGAVPRASGEVLLDGTPLPSKSYQIVKAGVSISPEGRKVFAPLTVYENLEMGAFPLDDRKSIADQLEKVYNLFPRLKERHNQYAGTLSGGEQQMLAIARALCLQPKVLLLDEPTEGLQPSMITLIQEAILTLKGQGVAVVLVEQRVDAVLKLADRVVFMVAGQIRETRDVKGLAGDDPAFRTYVGV